MLLRVEVVTSDFKKFYMTISCHVILLIMSASHEVQGGSSKTYNFVWNLNYP